MAAEAQSTTGTLWGLQGSASLKGKQLTLTVVNPHASEARESEVAVRGGTVQSGQAILSANDIHTTASNPGLGTSKRKIGRGIRRHIDLSVCRLQ
jgi:alpha-N-arabinofuranosidase